MNKLKPKSTNGLMKHLRKSNITIIGSYQKNQLINHGYFHGYKGYRYPNNTNSIPFSSYEQISKTIVFDSKLKSLLYERIMYIETALKSIVTQIILDETKSENINDMYNLAMKNYHNCDPGASVSQKKDSQKTFISLKSKIISSVLHSYEKKNPKIKHYYEDSHQRNEPPVWAIIDNLTMGVFGNLCASLTYVVRSKVSDRFDISRNFDTTREIFYRFVYLFKNLRNAVAHNEVVYNAKFAKPSITRGMETFMRNEMHLPYYNCDDIIDYVALIVFFQKKIKVSNREQKSFIKSVKSLIDQYFVDVGPTIASLSFRNGWQNRLSTIVNYCR